MAITKGTPIGSGALNSWSAFPISDSVGGTAIALFRGDLSSGAVTASGSADSPALSAAQLASLSSLLTALIANGAPTTNALSFLRKLIGVVGLTNGDIVSITAANIAGNVWELRASLASAGTLLVYYPNSAAAGLFTGFGADADASVIPTTQRSEYVANIPGLPLGGVACLSVPNPAGTGQQTITLTSTLISGFASTAATVAAADFRVEKFLMSGGDPGIGLATHMFDINFAVGDSESTVVVPGGGGFTVLPGFLYRVVNPSPANATLADVAITLVGQLPL